MAISSPGIGSGLDVSGMVSQLMALERRPLNLLDQREVQVQAKISAFGSLKGSISAFQGAVAALATPARFSAVKATSADTTVFSAAAGTGAASGSYGIEVTQLARAQKLATAGQASSTAAIGTGTLTFDFGTISLGTGSFDAATGKYTGAGFASAGTGTKTVTIDTAHGSLEGIRDAINAANIGVNATIINDGSGTPYRLALSVAATGAASSLKISVAGDAGLSSLLAHDPAATQNLSETVTARNALLKVDGLTVTKASNVVTDVIQGVTLTLLKETPGASTQLTVAKDSAGVKSSVEALVKAFNDLNKTLTDLSKFDAASKKGSVLTGDSAVRGVQTQLRSVLGQALDTAGGGLARLSDIGVTLQLDGTLKLDAAKLQKAIDDPTKDIATLFAAMAKTSDPLVSFTASTADSKPGQYALDITQLATQGKAVGAQAAATTITAGVNDALNLTVDGKAVSITLAAGTYTAATLATELQGKINGASSLSSAGASVKVSEAAGVLTLTSARYGSASVVDITGGNAMADLFGAAPVETAGVDVAGTIGGQSATGSGQVLTGGGADTKGLAVTVTGGTTGARGTANFAQGFAYQLDILAKKLLQDDGLVDSRIDGLNDSVKDIGKQRERLQARMVQIEARYRRQFTALDTMIASMNKTSNFLQQQLANLPKANGSE